MYGGRDLADMRREAVRYSTVPICTPRLHRASTRDASTISSYSRASRGGGLSDRYIFLELGRAWWMEGRCNAPPPTPTYHPPPPQRKQGGPSSRDRPRGARYRVDRAIRSRGKYLSGCRGKSSGGGAGPTCPGALHRIIRRNSRRIPRESPYPIRRISPDSPRPRLIFRGPRFTYFMA